MDIVSDTDEIPDIVFALHGLCMTLIELFQVLIYEKGDQIVSNLTIGIIASLIFGIAAVGGLCAVRLLLLVWLIQAFGFTKMVITLIKYSPQVWLNYQRQSTQGWSIGAILLDFSGGMLSFFQMFLLSIYENDWSQFEGGNIPKLGLSVISIGFDIVFMIQHYCLYRKSSKYVIVVDEEKVPINVNTSPNSALDNVI